jgi:hypothetical protein
MQIWQCKIGECDFNQHGKDLPMREAVATAYRDLTGHEPTFLFSGWSAELTEPERAVVEDRDPDTNDLSEAVGVRRACESDKDFYSDALARKIYDLHRVVMAALGHQTLVWDLLPDEQRKQRVSLAASFIDLHQWAIGRELDSFEIKKIIEGTGPLIVESNKATLVCIQQDVTQETEDRKLDLLKRCAAGERNLSGANLTNANLTDANLTNANLTRAHLTDANLTDAYLSGAHLTDADLAGADLTGANLTDANLTRANLTDANLTRANLTNANLTGVRLPAPAMVLLADWGQVSEALCVELMRHDAENHPCPEKFDMWPKGGPCPYEDVLVGRAALFRERRSLWSPGPAKSAYELMIRLFKEKGVLWQANVQ